MKKVITFSMVFISIFLSFGLSACASSSKNSNDSQTEQSGVWAISYYVDEFNNPTDESYISNSRYFVGSFSNSATTNSKLNVKILIDKKCCAIKLWEYGSQLVKGYYDITYNITFLNNSGEKTYSTATLNENSDRLILNDSNIVSLIKQNTSIRVYIEENSKYGYNSTYLFEIDGDNFNTIYNQL